MVASRILGLNLSLDHTLDVKVRDDFNRALLPAQTVVMVDAAKDIPKIIEYQKAHPYTTVIGRVHYDLDGGMHEAPKAPRDAGKRYIVSPLDWINAVGVLGQGDNGWCYCCNEPDGVDISDETKDRLVAWIEEWQQLAIIRGVKSVLFNFGDRHPKIVNGQWETRFNGILRTCARHPDLFRIGLHSYGPDGLVEHLEALVATCKELGIKPVEVVITEYGLDTHLGSPDGYKARGWTGGQYATWMGTTINGELRPYIESGVIVGLCTFCWNANPRWKAFDVQLDKEWRETIIDIAGEGRLDVAPVQSPPTVIVELPDDAMGKVYGYVNSFGAGGGDSRPLRANHTIDAPEVARIVKKDTLVRRYSMPVEWGKISSNGAAESKGRWNLGEIVKPVISSGGKRSYEVLARGWFWADGISWVSESSVTAEVPITPPADPPAVEIPTPQPAEIVLTLTRTELDALITAKVQELLHTAAYEAVSKAYQGILRGQLAALG